MLLRGGDLDAYDRLVRVVSNIVVAWVFDENPKIIPDFIVEGKYNPSTDIGSEGQYVLPGRFDVLKEFVSGNPFLQSAGRRFPGVIAHRPVDGVFIRLQSFRRLKILTVVSKYGFFLANPAMTGDKGMHL